MWGGTIGAAGLCAGIECTECCAEQAKDNKDYTEKALRDIMKEYNIEFTTTNKTTRD